MAVPHICVCICTYRRTAWLRRLLEHLSRQETAGLFTLSAVVADNDNAQSAREVVEPYAPGRSEALSVVYCVEPQKNIALVRNRTLAAAAGDWIAFIDDDEFPEPDWLRRHYDACLKHEATGSLGPVRPHFEVTPPNWVLKSGLYHRPEHDTGYVMPWRECRTGNVLLRRAAVPVDEPPFDARFPNGGEDQDFFRRLIGRSGRFIWCNEAVVHETVPPARWDVQILARRALLRGQNTMKHSRRRAAVAAKSGLAVVLYGLSLPLLACAGRHLYVRYLIKFCDHAGKLMSVLGITLVRDRAG